jgi:hypothetical protein
MRPIYVLCLASVLVIGCRSTEDFARYLEQPLQVRVSASGQPAEQRTISPESKEHQLLVSWLTEHKSGWKQSLVTYAPGVLVSGTNFTMNIHSSRVIINAGGRQYVRDTQDSDFRFLKNASHT